MHPRCQSSFRCVGAANTFISTNRHCCGSQFNPERWRIRNLCYGSWADHEWSADHQSFFWRQGSHSFDIQCSLEGLFTSCQRWKPVGSTGTGRVDRPVGLPVWSRFFDRPVKPVEKPVEFSFLATKKHPSTNRNILIYIFYHKTFFIKNQY